jgi:enolase
LVCGEISHARFAFKTVKDEKSATLSRQELADLYTGLITKYPIVLIEDPFAQDDWESWKKFEGMTGVELVGDDLLVTNVKRVEKKACNAILLKVNQIGTITEVIAV